MILYFIICVCMRKAAKKARKEFDSLATGMQNERSENYDVCNVSVL